MRHDLTPTPVTDFTGSEIYSTHFHERRILRSTVLVLAAISLVLASTVVRLATKPTIYRYIRIDEAGLGTKIEVPTIDGRALLKVPQGTKNGQKFRLREKGVQNSKTGVRGDQIVEIAVEAPVVHDERTKELLRELAQLNPEDPRAEIWNKVG